MFLFIGYAALLSEAVTSKLILAEVKQKLDHAKSLTVTVISEIEEFHRSKQQMFAYRKGGYLRIEDGQVVTVANPTKAWAFSTHLKKYKTLPLPDQRYTAVQIVTVGIDLPILSEPVSVRWHGMSALKIEFDGRQAMPKETKLFGFYDPKSHLPLGISANLGSMTQITIFKNLKLDAPLADSLFTYKPRDGWTKWSEKS